MVYDSRLPSCVSLVFLTNLQQGDSWGSVLLIPWNTLHRHGEVRPPHPRGQESRQGHVVLTCTHYPNHGLSSSGSGSLFKLDRFVMSVLMLWTLSKMLLLGNACVMKWCIRLTTFVYTTNCTELLKYRMAFGNSSVISPLFKPSIYCWGSCQHHFRKTHTRQVDADIDVLENTYCSRSQYVGIMLVHARPIRCRLVSVSLPLELSHDNEHVGNRHF